MVGPSSIGKTDQSSSVAGGFNLVEINVEFNQEVQSKAIRKCKGCPNLRSTISPYPLSRMRIHDIAPQHVP